MSRKTKIYSKCNKESIISPQDEEELYRRQLIRSHAEAFGYNLEGQPDKPYKFFKGDKSRED